MIRTRYTLAASLMLVWAGWPDSAVPQPEREVYGDWAVRCVEREALPPCDMVQFATRNESGEPVMQFSVAHAGRNASYGIQIMVPLGVRLSTGVTIRVDGGPPLADFQFTRCEVTGCFIERVVTDAALAPFKAGNAGILAIFDRRGEPLVVPLSFMGFTKALTVMTEQNLQWASF